MANSPTSDNQQTPDPTGLHDDVTTYIPKIGHFWRLEMVGDPEAPLRNPRRMALTELSGMQKARAEPMARAFVAAKAN
jgi:hypothetical protein